MKIIINSQQKDVKEGVTLQQLLEELSLEDKVMAAAVNMQIVKQKEWGSFVLHENDKLELLDFVGGG